jgi:hypothetical protein
LERRWTLLALWMVLGGVFGSECGGMWRKPWPGFVDSDCARESNSIPCATSQTPLSSSPMPSSSQFFSVSHRHQLPMRRLSRLFRRRRHAVDTEPAGPSGPAAPATPERVHPDHSYLRVAIPGTSVPVTTPEGTVTIISSDGEHFATEWSTLATAR